MAIEVQVWDGDLQEGTLPPICALTGVPTSGFARLHFRNTPRWLLLLLVFGVVPYIVATLLTRRDVNGIVPLSPQAQSRLRRHRAYAWGVCLGIPVACFAAAWAVAPQAEQAVGWLVVAGFLGAFVAAIVSLLWYGAISVRGSIGESGPWGRWVRLYNVNPTFVAAVERMYAERAQRMMSAGHPAFPPLPGVPPPWAFGPAASASSPTRG